MSVFSPHSPDRWRAQCHARLRRNPSETYARAVHWLQATLGIRRVDVGALIEEIKQRGSTHLYAVTVTRNADGSQRLIFKPKRTLRTVQKAIHREILGELRRDANSFGFMGGRCRDVAERHRGSGSILTFDVKNAFFRIGRGTVQRELISAGLSWRAAEFIADLCTYRFPSGAPVHQTLRQLLPDQCSTGDGFLPPGAATSPKLFEICCRDIDRRLGRKAGRLGGVYSRYADNIFFSMPQEEFPPKLKKAILMIFQHVGIPADTSICGLKSAFAPGRTAIPVHKVRVVNHGGLCRILGLNVVGGTVRNTRRFKRKLRGALHHLEYVITHDDLPLDRALGTVQGLLGFAERSTLPPDLLDAYERCRAKIPTT